MDNKNKRPKISLKKLQDTVSGYFALCEEKGRFPTESGLILALGLRAFEYAELKADKNSKAAAILERAELMRCDWLENRMVTEKGSGTGCLNALKQPSNGGWAEKTSESRDRALTIIMSGIGEDAAG
ncbi:MAG: hypothetical protein GX684_01295 [Ruminococcaceae bacterium]|nr:hypothetical protein [Oscillospiraceae bacterium]